MKPPMTHRSPGHLSHTSTNMRFECVPCRSMRIVELQCQVLILRALSLYIMLDRNVDYDGLDFFERAVESVVFISCTQLRSFSLFGRVPIGSLSLSTGRPEWIVSHWYLRSTSHSIDVMTFSDGWLHE